MKVREFYVVAVNNKGHAGSGTWVFAASGQTESECIERAYAALAKSDDLIRSDRENVESRFTAVVRPIREGERLTHVVGGTHAGDRFEFGMQP